MFIGPIGKTRWPPQSLIGWVIFDFFSETNEQNSTKLDSKQDLNVLYQVCVFQTGRQKDGRPGLSLCETFLTYSLKSLNGIQRNFTGSKISISSTKCVFFGPIGKTRWPPWPLIGWDIFDSLLWNRWTEFNETWQEARSKRILPSLCYWGRSQKQDGRPGLWLADTFSTSSLTSLNGIQRNLTGSKLLTSSTKFVFFGPICKTRWPPWPLIGWEIFDFSDETAERNSKKLNRKEDLNVFYQVCVFRADRKIKMAAPSSDCLRHFDFVFWNRWTEFNKTLQERISQCPLPSLWFSGRSEK